jgi:hypothetical protein
LSGVHPFDQGNPILTLGALPATMEVYAEYSVNFLLIKKLHPDWNDIHLAAEAAWMTLSGKVHTALDIIGLEPTLGSIADFTNGVLYTIEGDGVNATMSFVAATPLALLVAVKGYF